MTVYEGCHKKCIVQHPLHFGLLFLKSEQKNLWHIINSVLKVLKDSELYIFLLKSILWWLETVTFQTVWDFPRPWTNLIVQHWAHFRPVLKVPEEKKLIPHSQSSFQNFGKWCGLWIKNLSFKINYIATWRKKWFKNDNKITYFSRRYITFF